MLLFSPLTLAAVDREPDRDLTELAHDLDGDLVICAVPDRNQRGAWPVIAANLS